MRGYGYLAVVAALVMKTASAAADGGPPPEPYRTYPPPVYERFDWSGIYLGAQGGWLRGENESFEIDATTDAVIDGPLFYDSDGYVIGGVIGVNLQTGNWVYGFEVDIENADFSGAVDRGLLPRIERKVSVLGGIRARLGLAFGRVLVYGAAGLAAGDVDMEAFGQVSPFEDIAGNDTPFGYSAAGGAEIALFRNWFAGIEYRFTDLSGSDHTGGISGDSLTYTHTNKFHAVRARLVYRIRI